MSQLLGYLGLPASIMVVFFAIYEAFAWLENLASETAKQTLTNFLSSTDWKVWSSKIAEIVEESFNAVFGSRHFSWKCLDRSIEFSLSSIFILLLLGFLNHYSYFRTMPEEVMRSGYRIIFFGWLLWSICIDYFNLFKTRLLIKLIRYTRLSLFASLLLIFLDLFLSFLMFHYSYEFLDSLNMTFQVCYDKCSVGEAISLAWSIYKTVLRNLDVFVYHLALVSSGPISNDVAVFFWAGLLPTLWLLIYVLATALTRLISKLSGQIALVFMVLDIEKHPLRAVGYVAATLVSSLVAIHGILIKIL